MNVSAVGMDVALGNADYDLKLYNNNGELLFQEYFTVEVFQQWPNGFIGLDFGSNSIKRATLSSTQDLGFFIDNVIYQQTSSPVPVPSAMLLLGSGLVGIMGVSRRKQKKQSCTMVNLKKKPYSQAICCYSV